MKRTPLSPQELEKRLNALFEEQKKLDAEFRPSVNSKPQSSDFFQKRLNEIIAERKKQDAEFRSATGMAPP